MIECLDDEDVGPLLETTFSLVILNWSTFDAATQDAARHLMKHIFDEKRRDVIKGVADVLPSLKGIPDFTDYDNEMQKLRIDNSVRRNYLLFSQRLSHEHESVVTQALHELETYLSQNQAFLQVQAISEQPDDVVGELVRSVLDACVRFNDQNHDIARLSARCVGIIGCLDANRVEAIRPSRDIVVIDNFDDSDEITDFVLFILEELIVKAFLSTKNPRIQSYLSYAMQELLLRCNVTAACLRTRNTLDASDEVYNKWLDLPESVQQTLTPFLRSKYVLQEMRRVETTYPIFASGKKYVEWLRSFVFDLLKEPHSSNALAIFDPLSRIVNKMDDPSVASFLLPYVVLHGVVLGTDEQWQNIQQELLGVLSSELSTTSHTKRTNLKLCSEVIDPLTVP
jgi:serine/threonine-protein kinase ATR